MATRFREFDWGSTPLGPVERWPESWRNAVNIILDSSFPTALALGPALIYFYNDAFIPLAGSSRHPAGLGIPVPVAWKEIWSEILEPRFKVTLETGVPTGERDLLLCPADLVYAGPKRDWVMAYAKHYARELRPGYGAAGVSVIPVYVPARITRTRRFTWNADGELEEAA